MKNCSYICGDSPKVNTKLEGCGISIFVHTGRRNFGPPIPNGFCTARLEIDFGELGDGTALFLYPYYNFSFMPKSMKNCKGAQGASVATCNPTKAGNQIFSFEDAQMRVTAIDGEPWFVSVDVCRILDIQNNRKAVTRLDDDERRVYPVDTPGAIPRQNMICVSESGLYALIFQSRKPNARAFRKWVTSEVLPALRKTGEYAAPDQRTVRLKRLRQLEEEIEIWKERYEYLSDRYTRLADTDDNMYLLSMLKAFRELIAEDIKDTACAEHRFIKKYLAANTLFPEAKRNLRNELNT